MYCCIQVLFKTQKSPSCPLFNSWFSDTINIASEWVNVPNKALLYKIKQEIRLTTWATYKTNAEPKFRSTWNQQNRTHSGYLEVPGLSGRGASKTVSAKVWTVQITSMSRVTLTGVIKATSASIFHHRQTSEGLVYNSCWDFWTFNSYLANCLKLFAGMQQCLAYNLMTLNNKCDLTLRDIKYFLTSVGLTHCWNQLCILLKKFNNDSAHN